MTLLENCPRGGTALETGIGDAFESVYLSLRGVNAFGIDNVEEIVERANQLAGMLDSTARFSTGDLFGIYKEGAPRWDLIHNMGVMEHFGARKMRAALAVHISMAKRVAFAIPSMHYPYEPEHGTEILWCLSELEYQLRGFEIETLRYFGDPAHGEKEHILCVLRGQEMNDEMRAIIAEADAPNEPGITVLILAKDEAVKLPDCLKSLWFAKEIIVGVMPSSDNTRQICVDAGCTVVDLEYTPVFDHLRNLLAERATTEFCVIADCDERFPRPLGEDLQAIAADPTSNFAGMFLPFRHYMGSHWLKMLGAGYTMPRLVRKGKFHFNVPLHSGMRLDGPSLHYPANDPEKMIIHLSNDNLSGYHTKQGIYTSTEALTKFRAGKQFSVVDMMLAFLNDLISYHDRGAPSDDGPWRLIYSMEGAHYRFLEHAKLYEMRYNAGVLQPHEQQSFGSVNEILALFNRVLNEPAAVPAPKAPDIVVTAEPDSAELVSSAPYEDPSGIGEDARANMFAMQSAGIQLRARCLPWSSDRLLFTPDQLEKYDAMCRRPARPGFVHLIQDLGNWEIIAEAGATFVRYMFETDRLPRGVPQQLNRMDKIIVPSDFNVRTAIDSGVDPTRLAVVGGCIDPAPYLAPDTEPFALCSEIRAAGRFTFLAVQEWALRKGPDILIPAFLKATEGRTDVQLVIKTWASSVRYTEDQIREQAARIAFDQCGIDLKSDGRIRIITDRLSRAELLSLYKTADAFCSATRGEGWGRPMMESMAVGKPTIATGGTGNTAFMNAGNSWLVDYDWAAVSPAIYAEIPVYKGHRCVEARRDDLIDKIRFVVDNPAAAAAVAKRGQDEICARFNLEVVGRQWAEALGEILGTRREDGETGRQVGPIDNPSPSLSHDVRLGSLGRGTDSPASSRKSKGSKRGVAAAPSPLQTSAATGLAAPSPTLPLSPSPTRLAPSRKLNLRIIGEFFVWHSLGSCNREFGRRFAVDPDFNVSIMPLERPVFGPEFDPRLQILVDRANFALGDYADFEIRHHYPPRLSRPADQRTKLILTAPWEYYMLPIEWIQQIIENVTEVWCYSQTVAKCYTDSGVPEHMVRVIPLGVDTQLFRPDAAPYQFTDEPGTQRLAGFEKPPTIFLAVGTIDRKGLGGLLEAYCNTFSLYDNVLLVVKDTCVETVYRGGTQGDRLRALANSPTGPAVIYIEQELPPAEHAGLFRIAHLVCLPYHNEGFCLPALEAQASGTPPCVPEGGPTSDFCNNTNSIIIPAKLESMGTSRIGDWQCCGETSRLVVNPRDLGRAMRWAHEHPEETAALGAAGAIHAREQYTWDHTVAMMKERLVALHNDGAKTRVGDNKSGRGGDNAVSQLGPMGPISPIGLTSSGVTLKDTSAQEKRNEGSKETPKLTLISGMEILDRRSVNAVPGTLSKAVHPNTQHPTPNTAFTGFPAILRAKPTFAMQVMMRDEEPNLPAFLTSVNPWCTTVYIVDTGSKDRSIEVARDYGAIVSERPWDFSFSNARNYVMDQTKGEEFGGFADCDDTLPPECGEGIQRLLYAAEDRVAGWLMQVHIPPGPGMDGTTIVDHLKIWRSGRGYRWTGRIHEQLLGSIRASGGIVQRTSLYYIHSGYDFTAPGQKKKRDRDEYLLRLDEEENPEASFPRFNSGMSRFHWNEFDTAIQKFHECIERADPAESIMRKVYAMLCGSYVAKRDFDNARKYLEIGLALTPNDPELLFRAGNLFRDLGDLPVAERFYLRLLTERESGHIDSRDVTIETYKGHHNTAGLYLEMGRQADAEAHFRAALRYNPKFVPSLSGLGELFVRLRRFDDAEEIGNRIAALNPDIAESFRRIIAAARANRAI